MSGVDRVYEGDGLTMAFTDSPCTAARPDSASRERAFLLVHGIGMGRIVFAGIAEELADFGRVLAVDLPGFGDSPEPGTDSTLEQTAAVMIDFARDQFTGGPAQIELVLIGHSMGTQVVAEMARRDPALMQALVLIAPTVNRYERTAARQAMRMLQDLIGESPKVLLLGLIEYVKTNPRWFLHKLGFMLRHHLERICPEIPTPTLVLRGEKDPVCPRRWVAEVAEALPRGEMREIPGRGHEAVIRSAEPVASMILSWLGYASGTRPDERAA